MVNSFQPLTIFSKISIRDVWLGSEYTYEVTLITIWNSLVSLLKSFLSLPLPLIYIFIYNYFTKKLSIFCFSFEMRPLLKEEDNWLDANVPIKREGYYDIIKK